MKVEVEDIMDLNRYSSKDQKKEKTDQDVARFEKHYFDNL